MRILEREMAGTSDCLNEALGDPKRPFIARLRAVLEITARRLARFRPVFMEDVYHKAPRVPGKVEKFRQELIHERLASLIRKRLMSRRLAMVIFGALAVAALESSCSRGDGGVIASGTIEATEVRLSPKVGGEVIELNAREGDRVGEGQVLARIDHTALDLQLEQARAEVRLAEAQFALLIKGARPEDIQQAQEALVQAGETLRLAREDAERTRELFATGSATQKQRDDAEARLVVAQAQANAAGQAVKKLQNLARPEEVQAAEARVDQAGIAVRLLEKSIQDTAVSSPLNGVVLQRLVEIGENVAPEATLFVVADLTRVELEVYVTEPDLSRITLGQEVTVRIDGTPPADFPGKITFIAAEAEFTPKNIQTRDERVKLVFGVKVAVDNPLGILKPGMPAARRAA